MICFKKNGIFSIIYTDRYKYKHKSKKNKPIELLFNKEYVSYERGYKYGDTS